LELLPFARLQRDILSSFLSWYVSISTLLDYGFGLPDFKIQTNEVVKVYVENKKRGCQKNHLVLN